MFGQTNIGARLMAYPNDTIIQILCKYIHVVILMIQSGDNLAHIDIVTWAPFY